MNATHKVCSKCGQQKPLEAFSPKKTGKYGRRTQCKACRRVPHLKEKREKKQACEDRAAAGESVKFCFRCETCKPLSEFSNSSKNADGKRSECKQCRSQYYVDNRERAAEQIQAYYGENKDEIKSYRRAYYRKNRQHENQCNRRYQQQNRERISLKKREYRKRKPEVKKVSSQRRLARQRDLPDTFTADDWQRALDYFGHRCAVCGYKPDEHRILAMDHWIPLTSPDCPGTVPENIVPLCHGVGGCNNEKQDKSPEQWLVHKLGKVQAQHKMAEILHYLRQCVS